MKNTYSKEVKNKWGNKKAFQESVEKHKQYDDNDLLKIENEMNELLQCFAFAKEEANSEYVQNLVGRWQEHISKYHYECSKEMLLRLAEMYIHDERFMQTMDVYKEGTTELIVEAIRIYCVK